MLTQTIQLLVKAFIIGVLVNISLLYAAGISADSNQNTQQEQQPLKQTSTHLGSFLSEP